MKKTNTSHSVRRKKLELVIVTGLSGAGRTEAVRALEDMGYFCIDNLPPSFILNLVELFSLEGSRVKQVAVVSDVRSHEYFPQLYQVLDELKTMGIKFQILFLEARDDVLVKRYKETRRRHPLSETGEIIEGIKEERRLLENLKGKADIIIDTSELEVYELRSKVRQEFQGAAGKKTLRITVSSFGFKYGLPADADIVMDVRFLPNPNYIPEIKHFSGEEEKIKEFVLSKKVTKEFLKSFEELLAFLIPHYIKEGKTHLLIALGCTGGTHRSVVLAEELGKFLKGLKYKVNVSHRDLGKDHFEV